MTNPPERELAVFSDAQRLPADQRAAFLDQACAGDSALRQSVEELLHASEAAGDFLQHPAAAAPQPATTLRAAPLPGEIPGDRIGHYKLLQQIGTGGCGVVYMAEQEQPVRRRVALKVIKLGMDTRNVIARFEAERQALALMDHPNIAKVLDAGATDTGRPYFVMELVRGIKITDYCDQNNLSTRERLELFIQICRAIQHAHQKGVIHRDIKPSNILVTMRDGVPEPKVIDFGIAKATTDQQLTDKTLFTAYEQFIGTPAYMSPEQAEMSALDIDTRSDIYSLGVLLYELLTGKTPFDSQQLLASGIEEMRRTIREKEPLRPSTRLSTMRDADLKALAQHHRSEPAKLTGLVRGDLDWIVMRCLEKDRRRRYETANGLAMDIERHLKHEPVVARPPNKVYRFQRLVRRNQAAFAAAITVVAALLVGLGVSTRMFLRARTEARKSRQVATLLLDSLKSVSPDEARGRDPAVVILERVADRVGRELKDQPAVAAEVRSVLGAMWYERGDYARAKEQQTLALALNEQVYGNETRETATALDALASTLTDQQNLAQSEPKLREALRLRQKLFGNQSREAARSLNDLGLVLWTRGDLAEANAVISQAVAIRYKVLSQEDPEVSESLSDLGLVFWEQGDLSEAESNLSAALELNRKRAAGKLAIDASAQNNLANVFLSQGNLAKAEKLYRQALENCQALPREHPHVHLLLSHLAVVVRRRGALAGDAKLLREALELNPADPLTADAIACKWAEASLTPLASCDESTLWRFTFALPPTNWPAPDFTDAAWQSGPAPAGFTTYSPRTDRSVTTRTNFWLRREFQWSQLPRGKLLLRLNRCQDGEVFLNGVRAARAADWSDAEVLVPCSPAGEAALKSGTNVLAVHCQDADGGTRVGVGLYVSQDPSLGRDKLLDEFTRMLRNDTNRLDLYLARANTFARLGRWSEAAADLNSAVEINRATGPYWYQLAPLLLETERPVDYRQSRLKSFDPNSPPDSPAAAAQLCMLALLAPASGPELTIVTNLADEIAAPGNAKATLAFRQLAKGLVEYRRGQCSSALQWMERVRETTARQDLPAWSHEHERNRTVAALLVQAMARQRLGQTAEAQLAHAQAVELIRDLCPEPAGGDLGREWPEWLINQILLREATALIHAPASDTDAKLR